jgi:hypothetical protein
MNAYFVKCDLDLMSQRLSRRIGASVDITDARDILLSAGFVEHHGGWLCRDLRPLMLAVLSSNGGLFAPPDLS